MIQSLQELRGDCQSWEGGVERLSKEHREHESDEDLIDFVREAPEELVIMVVAWVGTLEEDPIKGVHNEILGQVNAQKEE